MQQPPRPPIPAIEWPTVGLVAGLHAGWLLLTFFHAALAWWMFIALATCLSAWWGSAQHEILHGHPTRHRRLNALLATPPYWLWLPYARYRDMHLAHHRDARLTDPIDDPESRYLTPQGWSSSGPIARTLILWQQTLAGRMLIGPAWTIGQFLAAEWRACRAGDEAVLRAWSVHGLTLAPVLAWVFLLCGVPAWLYLVGIVFGGLSLTLIRSFAEHRAAATVGERTAIVENATLLGPLFLHNNLHVAHHRWPAEPWYRLPELYRARRAELIAANGGLVYDGYEDLFRRYFVRPHDAVVHPLDRAP